MKKMVLTLATGLFLTVVGTGCKSAKNCSYEDLSGKWIVTAIVEKSIATDEKPFIEFDTVEKRIHSRGPCNIINSPFELSVDNVCAISFPAPMSTMMACPELELEGEYLKAINNVAAFRIDGERLELLDADNSVLIGLTKEQ